MVLLSPIAVAIDIVREAHAAARRGDFSEGEELLKSYRAQNGLTPEGVLALSWMARIALDSGQTDKAETYAAGIREQSSQLLKTRALDAEARLPMALGAAIEVHAESLTRNGQRSEAIAFLRQELKTWGSTSIRTRIQKNLNLLSLRGKPAPEVKATEWLGRPAPSLASLKGKPVMLFFWAHWCGDCKAEIPVLARIEQEYGKRGLVLLGPTQRYGYTASGLDAAPAEELRYIDEIRKRYYSSLGDMPVPVSEESFQTYGCSTTPTLVLIDRAGLVRLYHPGNISYEELAAQVEKVAGTPTAAPGRRP